MENLYVSSFASPLGKLYLAATPKGVCRIEFGSRAHFKQWLKKHVDAVDAIERDYVLLKKMKAQLRRYFKGRLVQFDVPLDPRGTPYQQKIWTAIAQIAYGQVKSYAELGRSIGQTQGFQAVGQACGANPLPIVVPCHRVLAEGHRMGGYGGGIDKKSKLLQLEKVVLL